MIWILLIYAAVALVAWAAVRETNRQNRAIWNARGDPGRYQVRRRRVWMKEKPRR